MTRDRWLWHILLIVVVSSSYELLFVHHGIGWLYDEGWPPHALRSHQPRFLPGVRTMYL